MRIFGRFMKPQIGANFLSFCVWITTTSVRKKLAAQLVKLLAKTVSLHLVLTNNLWTVDIYQTWWTYLKKNLLSLLKAIWDLLLPQPFQIIFYMRGNFILSPTFPYCKITTFYCLKYIIKKISYPIWITFTDQTTEASHSNKPISFSAIDTCENKLKPGP